MKTIIHYCFEPADPPIGFVGEAIIKLHHFVLFSDETKSFIKGLDGPGLLAHTKIIGKDGFSEQDVRTLSDFLRTLGARAYVLYKDHPSDDAMWRDSILQSSEFATKAADQLLALFYSLAPNLKPIAEPVAEAAQKPVEPAAQPPTTATPNPTDTKP